jgi:hypothetical protein
VHQSFNVFLADLNDGATLAGLTADLQELLQAVRNHGRSGSMTLKLKVAPATKGGQEVDKITITAERKLELPKPDQPQDFFWLTADAQPSRKHPRQQELPLRQVPDQPIKFSTPDADGVVQPLKELTK